MKRKIEDSAHSNGAPASKKRALSDVEAKQNFRDGLFDNTILKTYQTEYSISEPYVELF